MHLECLILYLNNSFFVGDETIGKSVVKSTEFHRIISLEFQYELIVIVGDG